MIFGFGGMRTDGDVLSFQPSLPSQWQSYRFRVCYQGAVLEVRVDDKRAEFQVISGPAVTVQVYRKKFTSDAEGVSIHLQPAP